MAETCYMCDEEATGKEHVPPKCLFPEEKDIPNSNYRKNLIVVPSCDAHNSQKSKDDEYLMVVLASCIGNNLMAVEQFNTKIVRVLEKKLQLLLTVYENRKKVYLENGSRTFAFQIDRKRVDREIDHIARGLYFDQYKSKWQNPIRIYSPNLLTLEGQDVGSVNSTTRHIDRVVAARLANARRIGENPEVFWYQIDAEPNGGILVIRACFYGGIHVNALSHPNLL